MRWMAYFRSRSANQVWVLLLNISGAYPTNPEMLDVPFSIHNSQATSTGHCRMIGHAGRSAEGNLTTIRGQTMFTKRQNALLNETRKGTPLGEVMRRYWIPALMSEKIPEPDSAPARVHILGEELVVFRDTNGRIGLVAEHCPHRGTSLFYGRNENCGLRCGHHGWKWMLKAPFSKRPLSPRTAYSGTRSSTRHTGPTRPPASSGPTWGPPTRCPPCPTTSS
jgi:nitrite reductase/ring-hydroxylating ferredoxin subunit